jgi:hypothetical protein
MRSSRSCSTVAIGFSFLIGLGIALLYYFFTEYFCHLTTTVIIAAVLALLALGLVDYTSVKELCCKPENGIKALCEYGFCVVSSAILTLLFALVALAISFYVVSTFTFIVILFGGTVIASLFIALGGFIRCLLSQNCPTNCK